MRPLRRILQFLRDLWLPFRAWLADRNSLLTQIVDERERHRVAEEKEQARHHWREEELEDRVRVREEQIKDLIKSNEATRSELDKFTAINQRAVAQAQLDPNSRQRPLQ